MSYDCYHACHAVWPILAFTTRVKKSSKSPIKRNCAPFSFNSSTSDCSASRKAASTDQPLPAATRQFSLLNAEAVSALCGRAQLFTIPLTALAPSLWLPAAPRKPSALGQRLLPSHNALNEGHAVAVVVVTAEKALRHLQRAPPLEYRGRRGYVTVVMTINCQKRVKSLIYASLCGSI